MKYLHYVVIAGIIGASLFAVLAVVSPAGYAGQVAIVSTPLSLWTARLVVALRRGRITRRIAWLDGGPTREGHFWTFAPEEYRREPGFDDFKGYVAKEAGACLLGWVLFLAAPVMHVLDALGVDVR